MVTLSLLLLGDYNSTSRSYFAVLLSVTFKFFGAKFFSLLKKGGGQTSVTTFVTFFATLQFESCLV